PHFGLSGRYIGAKPGRGPTRDSGWARGLRHGLISTQPPPPPTSFLPRWQPNSIGMYFGTEPPPSPPASVLLTTHLRPASSQTFSPDALRWPFRVLAALTPGFLCI